MNIVKKTLPFLMIIILILFVKNKISEIQHLKGADTTIDKIQSQLIKEKQQQSLLQEQIKFMKSNEFVEEEARDKLNYTKKGEALVIGTQIQENKLQKYTPKRGMEIWQKWFEKLF